MLNIRGNSEYKLNIDGNFIIKKSTSNTNSDRLKKQCQKQEEFYSEVFNSPKIYETNTTNGLFWFKMEFIPFKTF